MNMVTRERIHHEADPVGFLCRIVNGEVIDGKKPTLDQRLSAARDLAKKIVPDLKSQELTATVRAEARPQATFEELEAEFEALKLEIAEGKLDL